MLWPQKKFDPPALPEVKLEGFRVALRPPRRSDWRQWAGLRAKNQKYLEPLEPKWANDALSQDFFLRRLQRQSRDWDQGRGYSFLIFTTKDSEIYIPPPWREGVRGRVSIASLKAGTLNPHPNPPPTGGGNKLIGGINLNHVCGGAAQYASLGYWLDEQHQGQGYMTEGLRLVRNFAFNTLGLHRLHAACLPNNTRSRNLLLKLGFEEEGFAKSYLQINGQWQDHVLFGLISPGNS